jgi:hypothetical protein
MVQLCVCAIARNETDYLLEWVAYQRIIGVDKVLIYDNGHDPRGEALLEILAQRDVITHVNWSRSYSRGPQVPAYNDALRRMRGKAEWLLFIDLDEYVVPVHGNSLVDLLSAATGLDGMWFPWLIFGSSGEDAYRPEPVLERFLWREGMTDNTVTPVKSAVRPSRTDSVGIHVHRLTTDDYANPLGEREFITAQDGTRRASQLARGYNVARVHHYMTKSRQEWKAKVARGRADRGFEDADPSRDFAEFTKWDRNVIYDGTALRFLPALKAEMRSLRELLDA